MGRALLGTFLTFPTEHRHTVDIGELRLTSRARATP